MAQALIYVGMGASLAFASAVQPGPLQAYLLARVAASGWRRTLPAACAPLLSDGPIAVVALLVLGQLSTQLQGALRIAGGGLLLFLAWGAFRQWRRAPSEKRVQEGKVPKTLLEAALVNLLNPNPYLGWTLILGPMVLEAWHHAPVAGVGVVVAFYATMVLTLGGLIALFGGASRLGPRFQSWLLFASIGVLAGMGVYQLAVGLRAL